MTDHDKKRTTNEMGSIHIEDCVDVHIDAQMADNHAGVTIVNCSRVRLTNSVAKGLLPEPPDTAQETSE